MNPLFKKPITNLSDLTLLLKSLHKEGRASHLEDDPSTVINGPTGQRIFSDAEADALRERMGEAYRLGIWTDEICPITILSLIEQLDTRERSELRPFTVIVELPKSLGFDYGQATRLAYVEARNAKEAKESAETDTLVFFVEADKLAAFEGEHGSACFKALHCFEGRLTDL